jgi:mercuric ion transport protein
MTTENSYRIDPDEDNMELRVRVSGYAYVGVTWLFIVGILMQVFLVGLSLLGRQPSWQTHMRLGHSLALLVLFMIILAYAGRLPRTMKLLTWLSLLLYVLLADVVIFMRGSVPIAAAFHPVLTVIEFALVSFLAFRAVGLVRKPEEIRVPIQNVIEAVGD